MMRMMRISKYIPSLRLRTLPLSMSGIILGSGLAWQADAMPLSETRSMVVFTLAILTTLSLQILSNLCNELGDAQKGTDAEQQGRAAYGLQAGTVTIGEMKGLIGLFLVLCIVFGTALIYSAFGTLLSIQGLGFLALGLLAVIGAVTYTLGKHSYGYIGLGDLGVFVFFGLLSTMGAYYLQTQTMSVEVTLAAVAIGLPCVGVLNLNNVRDMPNDRVHGKRTFASLLGPTGGRVYQTVLLVGCLAIFAGIGHYWTLCVLPVWGWHIFYIFRHDGHALDKQMPVLMFTTLIVALLAIL